MRSRSVTSTTGGTLFNHTYSGSGTVTESFPLHSDAGTQTVSVVYYVTCTAGHNPTSITVTNVAAYRNP